VAQRQHQAVAPGSEHRVEALHEGVELGWPGPGRSARAQVQPVTVGSDGSTTVTPTAIRLQRAKWSWSQRSCWPCNGPQTKSTCAYRSGAASSRVSVPGRNRGLHASSQGTSAPSGAARTCCMLSTSPVVASPCRKLGTRSAGLALAVAHSGPSLRVIHGWVAQPLGGVGGCPLSEAGTSPRA
jgi:hypothetical protein